MTLGDWVSDTPSWALLAGVVAPVLTAVVNQPDWAKPVRQAVAIGVAVVLGVLGCLATGSITDGMTVLQVAAVVVVGSWASYKTITSSLAPAIERATSSTSGG